MRRRLAEMPKTLTGAELQLDDGPVRDSDLFLVDGNNLAYRAFFALPEELATSEGFSTNALLGFTNMLFKLLADYRPKGVAVAWDTRPVHRTELLETYKIERKPMPDLLREQFPHFRPIVEAFGYRNLEFEGWEADDVIATLAHRADEAGVKTCVVSTDRDAFQLVSENVCLMMTPRGVSDVHVYTPERVELRLGIAPEKVPDFIALKGDPSDNIPGIPGIGDKTAGQLVAQYGSLEDVLEHVDELSPARSKAIREHADQARGAKVLATMRRDLELDCDPAELVLSPPDRSTLKEIFRKFEFRNLLNRVDELDAAVPAAAPLKKTGVTVPWREELVPPLDKLAGIAADDGRVAVAVGEEVVVSSRPDRLEGELVAHDAKSLAVEAVDDTMILAYLIEPGRAGYELDDLAAEYGLELIPEPEAEEETAALVRQAAGPGGGEPAPPAVIVDLCCGSGAVGAALAATLGRVELYAVDVDPAAVRCARRNVASAGGQVYQGDLYGPLPARLQGHVDVLAANVPYVPTEEVGLLPPEARDHEPRVALDGGADGLDILRRVTAAAPGWLAPGGHLLFETSERQAPQAVAAAARAGLIPRVARSGRLNATVVIGTRPARLAPRPIRSSG